MRIAHTKTLVDVVGERAVLETGREGKQREGLLCIGGVCRQVPASNGMTFSLTTSF